MDILTIPQSRTDQRGNVVEVAYSSNLTAVDFISQTRFHAEIQIAYVPGETIINWSSVADWLTSFAHEEVILEELAQTVFDKLREVVEGAPVRVTITVTSGQMGNVSVTAMSQ